MKFVWIRITFKKGLFEQVETANANNKQDCLTLETIEILHSILPVQNIHLDWIPREIKFPD